MADDVLIKIGASAKQYQEELDKVLSKTEDLRAGLENAAKVSAAAFIGLTAAITGTVYAYADAEKVANATNSILEATGGIAGVTAEDVSKLGDELAALTKYSDESVKSAQNVLLGFTKIHSDVFPQATKATLDLATKLGVDAPQAAELLGKALQRPTEALGVLEKQGVTFTEGQKKQIELFDRTGQSAKAQEVILTQLSAVMGGLAEKELNTLAGALTKLKNDFGEVAETIGQTFAPIFRTAIKTMDDFAVALKNNPDLLKAVAIGLGAITAAAGTFALITAGAVAFTQLQAALEVASLGLAAFRIQLTALQVSTVIGAIAALGGALYLYYNKDKENVKKIETEKADIAIEQNKRRLEEVQKQEEQAKARKLQQATEDRAFDLAKKDEEINAQLIHNQNISDANVQLVDLLREIKEQQRFEDAIRRDEIYVEDEEAEIDNAEKRIGKLQYLYDSLKIVRDDAQKKTSEQAKQYDKMEYANRTGAQKLLYDTDVLALQQMIQTESDIRKNAEIQEQTEMIQKQNRFLQMQQQYGAVRAYTDQVQHSVIYQGTKSAFENLEELSQSKYQVLKTIGKAAAVTNIVIKTAEAAINIFNGFSTIPIVGFALGLVGAAAAVAFGAEKVSDVLSANDGGMVTGGIPGIDSVPALLTPGELVVPDRNFNEVVSAVATQRNGGGRGESFDSSEPFQTNVNLTIGFEGNEASQLLTARLNEDDALGISRKIA